MSCFPPLLVKDNAVLMYTLAEDKSFSLFLRFAGHNVVSKMRWLMIRVNKTEKSAARIVALEKLQAAM